MHCWQNSIFTGIPNSRNLEELTAVSYSSVALLKDRVGNTRTYIRPLQCDQDMDTANLMVYKAMLIITLCPKEAENVPKPNNVRYRSSLTTVQNMCSLQGK